MLALILIANFALILYFITIIIESWGIKLFNTLFFESISKSIESRIDAWVSYCPNDEWIDATDREFTERKIEEALLEDTEEIEEELLLGQSLLNSMWIENSSNLFLLMRCIVGMLYVRYMLVNFRFAELLFGGVIGSLLHTYHVIKHLFVHFQKWYFDQPTEIDFEALLLDATKLSAVFVVLAAVTNAFLLTFLKSSVYTRIIGEWVFDVNFVIFVFAQIFSYYGLLATVNLIYRSRKSPILILILFTYVAMMAFI